jgi:uncharacterized protein
MRIEWDEDKNISNQAKHDVSFEFASEVFDDPLSVSVQDRIEGGERRWNTIGVVGGIILLIVAHTWWEDDDDEVVRIISARRATRKEQRNYENS